MDEHRLLKRRIHKLMREIRQATPTSSPPDWRKPAALFKRDDYLYGKRVPAVSIILFPTGCMYAREGGCTMCGEWSGSNLGKLVHGEYHVAQFASAYSSLIAQQYHPQWIRIYQEGSFINDNEVMPDAQAIILRLASSFRGVKRVTIESRVEFLTRQKVSDIRSFVDDDVEFEIGIGFEAQDDFILNVCVSKGTTLAAYERAVKIAHDHDTLALAYVLVKPPFLSEGEAVEEAVKSVKVALEIGFDEVYIQSASIHAWSLSELLWKKNLYSPTWLWSVIEVIKRTYGLGLLKIGGLEYFPIPSTVAQNYRDVQKREQCSCTPHVWNNIQEFNATHDLAVLDAYSCDCKELWASQLTIPSRPLPERVADLLNQISVIDYLVEKSNESKKR